MFYKGSLKLLNHLIREFKSVSQQPLYELNTLVCLLNSRHCFYYSVDKKTKTGRELSLFLSCLIYGNKNEWDEGKEEGKDREKELQYSNFTNT